MQKTSRQSSKQRDHFEHTETEQSSMAQTERQAAISSATQTNKQTGAQTDQRGVDRLHLVVQQGAEARHFAHQATVDQHLVSGQAAVDEAHLRQVLHPRGNGAQHVHQLQSAELALVLLSPPGGRGGTDKVKTRSHANMSQSTKRSSMEGTQNGEQYRHPGRQRRTFFFFFCSCSSDLQRIRAAV